MVKSLLIHTFEFLEVLLMLLMFMFLISFFLVLKNVFFFVILLSKTPISYMISKLTKFSLVVMLSFMRIFFLYESIDTSFTTIDPVIPNIVPDNPPCVALPYTPPPPTENKIRPPTNSPHVVPLRHSQRSHGPPVAL